MKIPSPMYTTVMNIFAGEYDIDYKKERPVILDIGANIGGFTVWANQRWSSATIHSYEPNKNNFKWLQVNTENIPNVNIQNVAVGYTDEERKLFYGNHMQMSMCSLEMGREQCDEGELVHVIAGSTLPNADIVKIDTEGWEVKILAGINFQPDIYLLEYHSAIDAEAIKNMLSGYTLVEHHQYKSGLGVVKYARQRGV